MLIPNNKALKDKLAKDEYELVLTRSNTTLTNQSIPNSKILQDSFSVNRFSVTGGTIEVGSATAAEMQVTIDNSDGSFDEWVFEGATIFARLKATISESAEYMDIGYFIVDEVVRQRDSIQLVCLDKMVWFDKAVVWSVEPNDGGFVFSTSPATLLNNICSACNVSYNSASFTANAINKTVTLAAPTSENLTYRQLLQWLCQVIGVCAYINESGTLTVAWYAQKTYSGDDAEDRAAQDIITPSNRFSSTIDRDPISISNVSVKVGETTYAANSNNTYTLAIEGNELITEDNYASILTNLATRLVGFSYYPFTADVLGLQWLQPLDITTFVDKDDVEHTVIITDWTYSRGRNTQLAGKGESATRKGYASNPPFTAAQQRIIEEIKRNQPEVDIDDRIEAVFKLNDAVNHGMMLHSSTVDGQTYYHDAATLADSTYIATSNSGGFAWTMSGWNSGNPSWMYGISSDGAAVLQTLSTYSLNADLITAGQIDASQIDVVNLDASNITTGTLQSADGTVTVNLDNKSINFGNKLTYDPTNGLNIDGSVTIGGSASIGDTIASEVADAMEDLDIKGIDDQVVEYAISTSGSDVPGGEGIASPSDTYYVVLNSQSDNYLSTIGTMSSFDAAHSNNEIFTAQELFSYFIGRTVTKYIYRFDRTESADGNFLLDNWTYVGKTTAPSYSTTPIVSKTLYGKFSSEPTISQIRRELLYNGGTNVRDNMMFQMQSGDKCYSFEAVLQEKCSVSISSITEVYEYGSSDADVIETYNCFSALSTSGGSSEKNNLKSNIDGYSQFAAIALSKWNQTNKYFYNFSASVLTNGEIVVGDNYKMIAEYGVSYPNFGGASWVSTMPDVSSNKGKYLWTRTTTTFTDNTSEVAYQATYIGQNGAAGQPGQNGTSVSISSIKYAVNQNQSTQPSDSSFNTAFPSLSQGDWLWTKTTYSNNSVAISKTYIGTDGQDGTSVTVTNPTRSGNAVTFYITDGSGTQRTVTLYDGQDGDEGQPGEDGSDGRTTYVHFAWADSVTFNSQGVPTAISGFATSNANGSKQYMGSCSDFNSTDPDANHWQEYSWTLVKGADGQNGQNGNDGRGVYSVVVKYAVCTNGSGTPSLVSGTSWYDSPPSVSSYKGKYLWTRTQTYYTDAPSTVGSTTYSIAYIATDGSNGKGVSSITQYFKASSDGTNRPTSGWVTTASSAGFSESNRYLWTYTVTTYSDNSTSGSANNAYVLGVWGATGSGGGSAKGITSITPQYALTASTTAPTEGSNLWKYEPDEYPKGANGMTQSYTGEKAASGSADTISGNPSFVSGLTYTIKFALEESSTADSNLYIVKNNTDIKTIVLERNNRSVTTTFTPNQDYEDCTLQLFLYYGGKYSIDISCPAVRYYYYQRDKIEWSDGSYTYTQGVKSEGFNAAIYSVNRLNTAFVETTLSGSNQVYIDAGHIYANSVTAYQAAFTEAFIKQLMANYVRVDGNIDVVNGDITISSLPMSELPVDTATSAELDEIAAKAYADGMVSSPTYNGCSIQERYNIIQPIASILMTVKAWFTQNKLVVKSSDPSVDYFSAVMPDGLVAAEYGNYKEYSLYSKNAEVAGLIKGLEGGRISNLGTTSSVWNYASVTFEKTYPSDSLPKIMLSYSVADGNNDGCVFVRYKNLTTSGFEVYAKSKDYSSTITVDWVAIP